MRDGTASSPRHGGSTGCRRWRAELGPALLPLRLDVTDAAAVAALPGSLPEGWREVDVLVNNAGLALGLDPAWKASLADWERMVATNVLGLIRLTRALLPGMVERNRGHVVNIGSIAGDLPLPGRATSTAAPRPSSRSSA